MIVRLITCAREVGLDTGYEYVVPPSVKTEENFGPQLVKSVKSVKTMRPHGPPVKSVKLVKPPVKTTDPSGPLLPPYRRLGILKRF